VGVGAKIMQRNATMQIFFLKKLKIVLIPAVAVVNAVIHVGRKEDKGDG